MKVDRDCWQQQRLSQFDFDSGSEFSQDISGCLRVSKDIAGQKSSASQARVSA